MKKVFLAALAVCTVFASCSKDESESNGVAGNSATLSINITAPENTRAAGTTLPGDAIGNYTVFVTDGTGEIAWKAYNPTSNEVAVTTAARNVYVVANAGDLTSIINMAGLNAYLADLNDATNPQRTVRFATGNTTSPLSFTQNSSGDFEATATITVNFIAARIVVTVVNNMTNYSGLGTSATIPEVSLNSIAVLNARGQSLLFGSSLVPATYGTGKTYYEGLANPVSPATPFTYFPLTADYTLSTAWLSDAFASPAPAGTFPDTYYYYVFENNSVTAATFPTIVTLVGLDENGDPTYWPVHLSTDEVFATSSTGSIASTGVMRGNSYNITITLTGDARNGGGGQPDPTIPVVNATITVSLTLGTWTPVVLNKVF